MPRAPTKVPRSTPKRAAALLSCEENVLTSDVLPANSSIDSGRPSTSHKRPIARWGLPDLRPPVVAEGGEGVLLAFQISAGHVVEKHIRRRRRLSLSKQPVSISA